MFLGTYTPKLDDKGRLTLPAKFRDELRGGLMITKGQDHCLYVFPRETFAEMARKYSEDSSAKDGGALGAIKRGELAPDIEEAIMRLQPGEISTPFRSQVGYHLFRLDSRESLAGDGLVQVRNQVRDILYRQKYDARLKDWLVEIKQRAIIDVRM